jgi:hypothetical protein
MPLSRISGNISFQGTSNRITGDMSNATIANRVAFQTSTTNGASRLLAIPNGTGTSSAFAALNNSDPNNASWTQISTTDTTSLIQATISGTGTYLPMIFQTGGSEKLRILTTGEVGIGTSSPATKLHVVGNSLVTTTSFFADTSYYAALSGSNPILGFDANDYILYDRTSNFLQTVIGGTERMRITNAGAVYIGDTTGSTRFYVVNDNRVAMFSATNTTVGTEVIVQNNLISSNNATASDFLFIGGISGGSDRVYILGNGNLQNINNSYGTLSDIKLKENIVDATSKLDDVMQLKVRNFNLKSDPTQKQIGFVAQEFETIFPSMIEEVSELDEDKQFTGNKVKGIKTTVLIPILVKAIQEQQTIIASLTSRIELLENQ